MSTLDQEATYLPHHIKIMKVAVALAILRQKPHGVGAKEYTSHLALQLSRLQIEWKEKASQLEDELLRTKQELITYQLRCKLIGGNDPLLATMSLSSYNYHCSSWGATNVSSNGHDVDVSMPPCMDMVRRNSDQLNQSYGSGQLVVVSQDSVREGVKDTATDSNWISSGYSYSQPQENTRGSSDRKRKENSRREKVQVGNVSETTNTNDYVMDTQFIQVDSRCNGGSSSRGVVELSHLSKVSQTLESHDKQPFTNTQTNSRAKKGSNLQERIRAHVKFCSSVSSLATLHGQLSDLMTFDLRDVLHRSISDALSGLTDSLCSVHCPASDLPLCIDLFESAVNCVVESIRLPLLSPFESELVESCVSLVTALISQIVQHRVGQQAIPSPLCSSLVILCGLSDVYRHGVTLIGRAIIKCAQNLEQAICDIGCLDVSLIQSLGSLTQTMEKLLVKYGTTGLVCCRLAEELENTVSGLVECFPLVCYSVWRIIGLLN